jgi:L-lactate dehydrogenase complex protein LldG
MSARDRIFAAIRAARPSAAQGQAILAEASRLLEAPEAIRPMLPIADPVEAFAARVVSTHVGATLARIPALAELPAAVAQYLAGQGLPKAIGLQPDPVLNRLDWRDFTLEELLHPDLRVGVGIARNGIAETGSLVFRSGSDTAVLGHFFPYHHIAAVRAATIVAYLDDYARLAAPMPRNLNLITGASGTTDIEGQLVKGAHGPRHLHIILIEDGNEAL